MTSSPLVCRLLLAAAMVAFVAGCSSPEQRTARYIERGQSFMDQDKPEKARLEFRNALQLSPNSADARYRNGMVEERMGEYARALAFYLGAVEADAKHDQARSRAARLYMFGGAPDRAMETLQQGLEARPDSVPLLAIRAAVKGRLNDPAGAIADGERALQLAPADEASIIVLAGLYNANDRAEDARKLLEGSLDKLPKSTDLREVLAQYYAQRDELPKAERMLVDLVKMQPKQAAARVTLARYFVSTGRVDDAERTMREAVRDLPENGALPAALVQLLDEKRGLPAAEAELRTMIAKQPKEYDLQFNLGRYLEKEKKWDEAEALYRKVIEAEGKKGPGLVARDRIASMYIQQNRREDDVRKLVAEVLAENPRDNEALTIRSSLALAVNDAKAAVVDLRALARDHPENVDVQRQLARAYLMSGEGQLGEDLLKQVVDSNPTNSAARFDLAQYYLQSGRPLQARSLTDGLVQQDPKSIEYLQAAFKAALAVKDYSATAAAVSAISAAAPGRAIGPYLAGVLADAQGKSDEAVRQYARALEIEPKAQEPLSAAVRQLMQQKRGDKALQLIDGIVARAPDDAFALNLRGELLASQQRWPEASASLEAASKVAPQWWLPVRNLALAHIGQGDTGGALQVLKDAAGRLEQSEPVAVDLATLLQRSGRTDEAIAAYQALATRHPESEVGANNLAMLLVSTRTDSASLKQAGDLVARFSQSKNPDYLDTRGWVLLKQGRAPEAVPVLEQAVSIAPEESATRYHLALAQFAAGQKQAARDNLERALQSKKDFEGIADARAKLAEWKQAG